jgi:hypothetical protein
MEASGADGGSVPPLLHRVWFNFAEWGEEQDVPSKYDRYRASWLTHNPGCREIVWNESSASALLSRHYPSWHTTFLAWKQPIQRADFFRWVALYHYGGLYADMDTLCLAPSHTLLPMQRPPHLSSTSRQQSLRATKVGLDNNLVSPDRDEIWSEEESARAQSKAGISGERVKDGGKVTSGADVDGRCLVLTRGPAANAVVAASVRHAAVGRLLDAMVPKKRGLLRSMWPSDSIGEVFHTTGPSKVLKQFATETAGTVRYEPLLLWHAPGKLGQTHPSGCMVVHDGDGSWGYVGRIVHEVAAALLYLIVLLLVLAALFARFLLQRHRLRPSRLDPSQNPIAPPLISNA